MPVLLYRQQWKLAGKFRNKLRVVPFLQPAAVRCKSCRGCSVPTLGPGHTGHWRRRGCTLLLTGFEDSLTSS